MAIKQHIPITDEDILAAIHGAKSQVVPPKAEPETWHRAVMEVVWTDSGKLFLRHDLQGGGRISYPLEITPEKARQMWEFWQRARLAQPPPLNPAEPPPSV